MHVLGCFISLSACLPHGGPGTGAGGAGQTGRGGSSHRTTATVTHAGIMIKLSARLGLSLRVNFLVGGSGLTHGIGFIMRQSALASLSCRVARGALEQCHQRAALTR